MGMGDANYKVTEIARRAGKNTHSNIRVKTVTKMKLQMILDRTEHKSMGDLMDAICKQALPRMILKDFDGLRL